MVQIHTSNAYTKNSSSIGADISINTPYNDLNEMKSTLTNIKNTLNDSTIKVSPFWWFTTRAKLNNDFVGLHWLFVDFQSLNEFKDYFYGFHSIKKDPLTSGLDVLVSLPLNSQYVYEIKDDRFLDIKSFPEVISNQNPYNFTLNVQGIFDTPPKISSILGDSYGVSIIADLHDMIGLIFNHTITITKSIEQGYFLWFPGKSNQAIQDNHKKLIQSGFESAVSPKISGLLDNEFKTQLEAIHFIVDLLNIFLVFSLIIIHSVKMKDLSESLEQSIQAHVFIKTNKIEIVNAISIIFIIIIIYNFLISLIISLGISLSMTIFLSIFGEQRQSYQVLPFTLDIGLLMFYAFLISFYPIIYLFYYRKKINLDINLIKGFKTSED